MKQLLLFLAFSAARLLAADPAAKDVRAVYILRMGGGLDQFLASELTKSGVYTVTTDASQADAIFTESLGEGFEKKLIELYPPPAAAKEEKKTEEAKDSGLNAPATQRLGSSSWGRGKGTIFLVDRKSRTLLWSMNRQPKSSATKEIAGQARKIVAQLRSDLGLVATK